jgi:hypothetical protein
MGAKESAVAKSRGSQDERDMSPPDAALMKTNHMISHALNASSTLAMKATAT